MWRKVGDSVKKMWVGEERQQKVALKDKFQCSQTPVTDYRTYITRTGTSHKSFTRNCGYTVNLHFALATSG